MDKDMKYNEMNYKAYKQSILRRKGKIFIGMKYEH